MLIHGVTMTTGSLWNLGLARRVVNDFQQAIAEHHGARRRCQILPTTKSEGSVMRTEPLPCRRGSCGKPWASDSPRVSMALRSATGLVSRKFVGAVALSHFRHQKAARRRSCWRARALRKACPHVPGKDQVALLEHVPASRFPPYRIGEARIVGMRLGRIPARQPDHAAPVVPLQLPQFPSEARACPLRVPADGPSMQAAHGRSGPPCRADRQRLRRYRG